MSTPEPHCAIDKINLEWIADTRVVIEGHQDVRSLLHVLSVLSEVAIAEFVQGSSSGAGPWPRPIEKVLLEIDQTECSILSLECFNRLAMEPG
ncbi:hypothetical protein E1287_41180 [Actinomadura sp. KC06]|nr:hypothetical protein E1287_41180 [Actinomadura sp. KC06]